MVITFEGGEGSGKSTQAQRLQDNLNGDGHIAKLVREPGETLLGETLRELLSGKKPISSPWAELFLFEASRAQLVQEVILPHLKQGHIIIADRFTDSSLAYQGYARGLDISSVRSINTLATHGITPDITIFLDVSPQEGLRRIESRRKGPFEEETLEFHERVREGYLRLAKDDPHRWTVIDGTRSVDQIAEQIATRVRVLLSLPRENLFFGGHND